MEKILRPPSGDSGRSGWRAGRRLSAVFFLMLLLSGCWAVGPDYRPPETAAPKVWQSPLAGGLAAGENTPEDLARWWRRLDDPQLAVLEETALKNNLTLKIARARIREARARLGYHRAGFFPWLDGRGSVNEFRYSDNSLPDGRGTLYAAGFDAGWEIDVFGGTRRAVEAARAEIESEQENLHGVQVTLQAEVALNYIELRTYQARLEVTRNNIEVQQQTFDLNRSLAAAGLISNLDLAQSEYNLEHSRSLLPRLESGLTAARNRLAVLLGATPGKLPVGLKKVSGELFALPSELVVGIPADTLRRRPDVRAAERCLAAATARIGEATAELYPKFQLLGSFGLESLSSGNFWQWAGRAWNFAPGVRWNLFDAGAIRSNIEIRNAQQEQLQHAYEETILQALEEVENALTTYAREQTRRDSLARAVEAARRADRLARDQYQAGLVDFNTVLIGQLSLLNLEDELAQSNGTVAGNLVRLYKALGGGWK